MKGQAPFRSGISAPQIYSTTYSLPPQRTEAQLIPLAVDLHR